MCKKIFNSILLIFIFFSFTTTANKFYLSFHINQRFFLLEHLSNEHVGYFLDTLASSENDGLKFLKILLKYFPSETSAQCRTDLNFTIEAQKNYTKSQKFCNADCNCKLNDEKIAQEYNWIKTLTDSYGKKGSYVQYGNVYWMGGYHECLSISASSMDEDSGKFRGRYCQISAVKFDELSSVCDGNKSDINKTPVSLPMRYGVCLPRSCFEGKIDPIEMSLDIVNFTLTCHDTLDLSTDVPAISMICVCSVFGVILLLASLFDLLIFQRKVTEIATFSIDNKSAEIEYYSKLGLPLKILLSFSIYSNAVRILNTDRTVGQLDCVHGIRFISMAWVMLGHTYIFGSIFLDNLLYIKNILYSLTEQTILNATFSVDTFFVLSGCLLAFLWLKETEKKSAKNLTSVRSWIVYYASRFIRLTPPYMLIMGLDITLFRYLSNGPMWPQNGVEKDYCKTTWWTNLLYINNLIDVDKMCFDWSWFLANDMQFYWVSPLVLVPMWTYPWIGLSLCVSIIIGSSIANGLMTYINNFPPNQIDFFMNLDQFNSVNAADVYVYPFTRAGPFFIGIILGYIIFKCQGSKLRLNRVLVIFLWCSTAVFNLTVLYGLYNVARGATIMNKVACAFYAGTSRSVWALGVAWIVFACVTGNGGVVNKFLSSRIFLPLSRLTYCAYLIHPLVIMFTYYSRETALHFDSDYTMVYFFFGHLVMSYSLAFIVTLAFESPILGLMKIFFSKYK